MQDLIGKLIYLSTKQHITTTGCMVDHIHLDNNTFSIKEQYAMLYYLDF
jgi:hypothetical protein